MMPEPPIEIKIGELFSSDQYVIPLYQRNYAWEEAEVNQLIQDIWDCALIDDRNYFIGTLVVHKRDANNRIFYETIDGQQRLTTLNILLSLLKNEFKIRLPFDHASHIVFDSRKTSSDTLKILSDNFQNRNKAKLNTLIEQAYEDMLRKLYELLDSGKFTIKQFSNYLFQKVIILRVEVPYDTDLNHYFEIMNNRGEQLEKHEILKASLLSHLKDDPASSETFNLIWQACSDMERYMQFGFKKSLRDEIFLVKDTWDQMPHGFEELKETIQKFNEHNINGKKKQEHTFIKLIVNDKNRFQDEEEEEIIENIRFNSVVNFSNFLLHVLRIFVKKDIPLDDKRLISTFEDTLKLHSKEPAKFVKDFAYCLFYSRFLFDKYIIKREYTQLGDSWSLKSIRISKGKKSTPYYTGSFDNEAINKCVLMLVSMFHVSFPQMIYKNWLSGVLFYLYSHKNYIDPTDYINYLEKLSDAFYFDRFGDEEIDYYTIVFKNKTRVRNKKISEVNLNLGTNVQNFIFNRLDYLIWKSIVVDKERLYKISNINKFDFSFRSSVEHFYPRNPKPGVILEPLDEEMLDKFGNLCLISRSKNSALSNYSPMAKAEHYSKSTIIESLKQQLMLQEKDHWNKRAIIAHQRQMVELLNKRNKSIN